MNKTIIQNAGKYFTEVEKNQIIQELKSSQCTTTNDVSYSIYQVYPDN